MRCPALSSASPTTPAIECEAASRSTMPPERNPRDARIAEPITRIVPSGSVRPMRQHTLVLPTSRTPNVPERCGRARSGGGGSGDIGAPAPASVSNRSGSGSLVARRRVRSFMTVSFPLAAACLAGQRSHHQAVRQPHVHELQRPVQQCVLLLQFHQPAHRGRLGAFRQENVGAVAQMQRPPPLTDPHRRHHSRPQSPAAPPTRPATVPPRSGAHRRPRPAATT